MNIAGELYKMAYKRYGIDLKNCPLYFVWDRDHDSNNEKIVKKLLNELQNPYENPNYESGILLLSYPCVESYTISCFEKGKEFVRKDIKEYVNKDKQYKLVNLNKHKLLHSTIDMINKIGKLGIKNFDIDNFGKINRQIFDKEEEILKSKKEYYLLSLISYILLDLGIITFRRGCYEIK